MARRLQDPLAELVRVEPKILAGFHHGQDVAKGRLERMLHEEVESCVHEIPIDLNSAPAPLLAWVGSMGAEHAKKIVEWRKANGPFPSRVALARAGLDEAVFRRSVAFLRVYGGADPLDATGVHPDHAPVVEKLVKAGNVASLAELGPDALAAVEIAALADPDSPAALLEHVRALLGKRDDPRGDFVRTVYNSGVRSIGHLKPGQELQGIVRGIANFGVFVDVGVSQDGLLHVSELASHFVKDPAEIVKVGDVVKVRVLSVEPHKKKIALTMKSEEERQAAEQQRAQEREARRTQRLAARERARERRERQAAAAARQERAAKGLPPEAPAAGGSPGGRPASARPPRPAPTPVRAATTRRDGVTGGKKRRGAPFERGRRDGRGRGGEAGEDLMTAEPVSEKAKSEAPPAPANPFKRFFQAHGLLES
jgi:uncharacterized protein